MVNVNGNWDIINKNVHIAHFTLVNLAMSTSTSILSANFPHVYGGRPRERLSNLRFGVTLTFKLTAGF